MKINGIADVLKVDRKGMNAILLSCGYPSYERMDKWDWKDFYAYDANNIVEEDAYYDLECWLNGVKVHNKSIDPNWTIEDPLWNEWDNYQSEKELQK